MKTRILGFIFLFAMSLNVFAQQKEANTTTTVNTKAEQEIIQLSKEKWQWMSDKNADALKTLFHEKAVFVHMGGSWGTEQELNVIKSGGIWYKKADIHEVSVNIIDNTAGNDVTNPFMVTEVYIKQNGNWKLGSLSFTRMLTPPSPTTGSH